MEWGDFVRCCVMLWYLHLQQPSYNPEGRCCQGGWLRGETARSWVTDWATESNQGLCSWLPVKQDYKTSMALVTFCWEELITAKNILIDTKYLFKSIKRYIWMALNGGSFHPPDSQLSTSLWAQWCQLLGSRNSPFLTSLLPRQGSFQCDIDT